MTVEFWNEGAARFLRKLLQEKGLRVEDLAADLDVSAKTVRNWMRTNAAPHRPYVKNFADLCIKLGVAQDDFRAAARAFNEELRRSDLAAGPAAATAPPAQEDDTEVQGEEPDTPSEPADHRGVAALTAESGARDGRLPVPAASRVPRILLLTIAGAAVLGVGAWAWRVARSRLAVPAVTAPPVSFDLDPAVAGVYDNAFVADVSPDGTQIAFIARSIPHNKARMLFVYSVVEQKVRPLPASEGNYTSFFWNSDSRSIFYVNKTDLMKIKVTGEPPERIGYAGEAVKGTVNGEGVAVLGSRKGLLKVTEDGSAEYVTKPRPGEIAHTLPLFLPDGDRVLFAITRVDNNHAISRTLAVLSLRTRAIQTLFEIPSRVQYVNGQLIYVRNRTLFARSFDAESCRLAGAERALAGPVWSDILTGEAGFSASTATLVVIPPLQTPPLHEVSAQGKILRTISEPEDVRYVAVGREELAVVAREQEEDETSLWLLPLDARERVLLATSQGQPSSPVFSPDARRVFYSDAGKSWANIYSVDLPAAKEHRLVFPSTDIVAPRDVSPDGRFLLFQRWRNRDGNLWYLPIGDPEHAAPLVATAEDEGESGRFSPDGKRVAFVAKRGSEYSIYVADFPRNGNLATRAIEGHGWRARWSRDGRRIYFARGASVMEADPLTRETRPLFDMPREIAILETSRDGGFFVRETPIEPKQTVMTLWWPRLAENPRLDLVK